MYVSSTHCNFDNNYPSCIINIPKSTVKMVIEINRNIKLNQEGEKKPTISDQLQQSKIKQKKSQKGCAVDLGFVWTYYGIGGLVVFGVFRWATTTIVGFRQALVLNSHGIWHCILHNKHRKWTDYSHKFKNKR